ncbi:hypothetical protein Q1J55_11210 [Pseudomonas syringae]|uniref:hypothetical protein n=1 Tax=Pseudomonas syringae TaxID=317 RepID=UPI0034D6F4C4
MALAKAGIKVGGAQLEKMAEIARIEKLAAKNAKNPNPMSSMTDSEAGVNSLPKLGSLKGEPELPPKNASPDMFRSIEHQNEASKKFAQAEYDVEQLPNTGRKGGILI